jgi:hypothetical protein
MTESSSGRPTESYYKDLFAQKNADNWSEILSNILQGRRIGFHLSSSDLRPSTMINELYDLIVRIKVDKIPFQTGLVSLFRETYFQADPDPAELSYLISAIVHVQPSKFVNELSLLVTSFSDKSHSRLRDPIDDLPIYYHLVQAVTLIDANRSLETFLLGRMKSDISEVYFQLCLRYAYRHSGQAQIETVLNRWLPLAGPESYFRLLSITIKEHIFFRKDLYPYVKWVVSQWDCILRDHNDKAKNLAIDLVSWLSNKNLEVFKGVHPFYCAMACIIGEFQSDKEALMHIEKLIAMDLDEFPLTNELADIIGKRFPKLGFKKSGDQDIMFMNNTIGSSVSPDNKIAGRIINGRISATGLRENLLVRQN